MKPQITRKSTQNVAQINPKSTPIVGGGGVEYTPFEVVHTPKDKGYETVQFSKDTIQLLALCLHGIGTVVLSCLTFFQDIVRVLSIELSRQKRTPKVHCPSVVQTKPKVDVQTNVNVSGSGVVNVQTNINVQ